MADGRGATSGQRRGTRREAKVAAWKHIPSWAVYGTGDLNIAPSAMTFMAKRAKSKATVIDGASHVVMISHPQEVAEVILAAAGE
ncbi:alpha/beta fold hydrolase [Sphingomonas sp. 3-13AW]|uniref:alpha/beta fold hydrolase n=1 Tax=Sphingomonas sp. 3-13AW TaxID=3050450 RepID=UPI003BB7D7A4